MSANLEAILNSINSRLAAIELAIGSGGGGGAEPAGDSLSRLASDFQNSIINVHGKKLEEAANALGAEGAKVAAILHSLFTFNLEIIDISSKCKKPSPEVLNAKLDVIKSASSSFNELCGFKVPLPFPDLAKGAIEGLSAFTWPISPMSPADTVQNGLEASEFYHNKVRKWGKEQNKPEFGAFANSFRDFLKALGEWTKDNAKMGLTWNAKGSDISEYKPVGGASAPAAAPVAASAPAAAPAAAPTPAPAPADASAAAPAPAHSHSSSGSALASLFSQINSIDQSQGKTEGLRHVTKDMKSSNNKGPVPTPHAHSPSTTPTTPSAVAPKKVLPPKVELVANRWNIEYVTKASQNGAPLVITETDMKQDVYVYNCKDIAVEIKGKIKGLAIDSCQGCTFLVDSALCGVEFVNCKRVKLQVRDNIPSIAIDKTDGILVGLVWGSRNAKITASKSSEMNLTIPETEAADSDWIELPIPEQFVYELIPGTNKLKTNVSELYTA